MLLKAVAVEASILKGNVVRMADRKRNSNQESIFRLSVRLVEHYELVKSGEVAPAEGVAVFASMMGELKSLVNDRLT